MLALSGDITFTVFKPDVTVPEIVLLKAIHGSDAVKDITPTFMDRRSHAEERERLMLEYGNAKDHKDESIFGKIFPGLSPLPVNFRDIGVDLDENHFVENSTPIIEKEKLEEESPKIEKPRRGRPVSV